MHMSMMYTTPLLKIPLTCMLILYAIFHRIYYYLTICVYVSSYFARDMHAMLVVTGLHIYVHACQTIAIYIHIHIHTPHGCLWLVTYFCLNFTATGICIYSYNMNGR